ncbi:MAG: ArsA family ATPase [Drouetiella hepatica Uher 2000/2452]|jgi:arsenite-transporting ATPase|uniref:ArsA family ATPase n=1 Tax=Drouetiella hepatica Uher 2000/2452 TaxID=904376 RepID=A0A951QGY7_9CYAN|nr:ArsA family ATPase [Drouetiella hepatica Uher 2000/2452]
MNHFDPLRLALFSGKGGVGKTTLSCGFARRWAQRFPTEQVLLLSTDPAHSLGDVLQIAVGDVPQAMSDLPNLQVRSLDAQALLQAFKADYGKVLEILVERGSFVEGEDLSPIWDLSWPGLDELMGILEIQRLLREQVADRVVVDMAPSGHTLNLFGLMDFLDGFLGALDLFQEKHRVMTQRFAGSYVADESDRFLTEMKADLASGRQLLQDPVRTACCVVAIPEPMSYLETRRFIDALHTLQIPVGGLFVNHIHLDRATPEQQELLAKFEAIQFEGIQDDLQPVLGVPQQPQEPVGFAAIDSLMSQIQPASAFRLTPAIAAPFALPTKLLPSLPNFLTEGRRLILVGGKGGVGKTTVAGAIAWHLAAAHPDKNIRVISIDPAHSLGDALGMSLTHQPTQISTNLSAQEIDAKQVLEQFREDYLWELAAMMSGDTGDESLQIAYTPQAWRQIVAQALPGIDEMLSLIKVMELLEQGKQDLIVLDTAPTGHLLRFLEMPTALADWLSWIFKLWIKYQDSVGRTELMGRLRTLRQRVMQTQKKLKDANHTEFIGVLQAQTAIVAEAERLTQSLADLGVSQRYIVHNRFEPHQTLPAFPAQTIVRLPQMPRGEKSLTLVEGAAELLF